MLRAKGILATVALLLIVSVAAAQEQPRGRGRGGPGGGGFGRGGGFGGMFNSPVGLLRMPDVRKELNVSEEQNKEIEEALAQLAPPAGGGGQDLSDEERQKRRDEMAKKGEEVEQKINKILKPEQQARLKQLMVQRQGTMALTRPEVAKDLGLTKEQQDNLQKIQESSRPAGGPGGFQNLSDEERQKLFTQMRERQEKAQAEMLAVLTDDQKAKFAEMKGKEFTFAPPAFGGPGGGAGGGGSRRRPETKQRDE